MFAASKFEKKIDFEKEGDELGLVEPPQYSTVLTSQIEQKPYSSVLGLKLNLNKKVSSSIRTSESQSNSHHHHIIIPEAGTVKVESIQ